MFYSYFDTRARMRPYGTAGITYSGAQSTIQAVQQALQAQQQMQQMQQMQQGIQPYYSSMEYYYPMHHITPYGISFSTIPYGTVYNL
ncbi:alpha/beta hydrolase [Bacillus sp. SRB_28]|nr:alpha/beta hydrolase [Bacillus sp. SRB_28]